MTLTATPNIIMVDPAADQSAGHTIIKWKKIFFNPSTLTGGGFFLHKDKFIKFGRSLRIIPNKMILFSNKIKCIMRV